MRAEALTVNFEADPMPERYAATLAIMAVSTQENRRLVSHEYGLPYEEVATWYWLSGEGLAVVDKEFKPRPQLFYGCPIYDGAAHVPPVTLRG